MASSGAEKRSRGNKIEVRILIPSKIAGSIIGKAGANIQQLRNNNNANVRVPDCEGPERVMNIQVDDAQTAINVIEQVNSRQIPRDAADQPPESLAKLSIPEDIKMMYFYYRVFRTCLMIWLTLQQDKHRMLSLIHI